jgi:hypothetical protein
MMRGGETDLGILTDLRDKKWCFKRLDTFYSHSTSYSASITGRCKVATNTTAAKKKKERKEKTKQVSQNTKSRFS